MSRVQLLVADEGNRRALAQLLEQRHEVERDEEITDADLFVVDDATLPEYRDDLLAHKRDRHPEFCPVVLIRREDTHIRIDLPDPDEIDGPRIVDEMLTAPVEKSVLFRRLVNLLVRRNQTRELREKTERLERFASMASHELRNPLNILQMYLPLARENGRAEDFDQCEQAVERMNRQIDDFLTLARKGTDRIETEPVGLSQAARDCWEVVELPASDLRVETDACVRADESKLFEVLENLFRNAIEHGGSDVQVTVGSLDADDAAGSSGTDDSTRTDDSVRTDDSTRTDAPVRSGDRDGIRNGPRAGFYVEDDGDGIPAEEREQVFEDGYSTAQHGTGFGLTIIDRIAEAHGWSVGVTEGPEGGARFEITGVERVADEECE